MPKTTKTVTVVECDRCGSTEDTGITEGRQAWGELNLVYKGHTGGRSWDGAGGGCNLEGKVWLCMNCTDDFLRFMHNDK